MATGGDGAILREKTLDVGGRVYIQRFEWNERTPSQRGKFGHHQKMGGLRRPSQGVNAWPVSSHNGMIT